MKVQMIGWTDFQVPPDSRFTSDETEGQALAEYAGRACYQSWSRKNPETATNAGYLRNILRQGHFSVLEHASVTFDIFEVSRALTHELIRHRHFSYSQLSQRYVPQGGAEFVEPDVIAEDPELHRLFEKAVFASQGAYFELLKGLEVKISAGMTPRCPDCGGYVRSTAALGASRQAAEEFPWACTDRSHDHALTFTDAQVLRTPGTSERKAARQAARYVLPNATSTQIIVTGNYRAWRHFIALRATAAADVEIRKLAIAVLKQLQEHAPNVFGDFEINALDDGTQVASSPYAERG